MSEHQETKDSSKFGNKLGINPKSLNDYRKHNNTKMLILNKFKPHLVKRPEGSICKIEYGFFNNYDVGFPQTIKNLALAIKTTNRIQKLEIADPKQYEMTDQALSALFEDIRKLTSLKSFALKFHGFYDLTDLTIQKIGQALKGLRNLQTLKLDFFGLEEITDIGIKYLSKSLKTLASLQNLNLDFSGCRKITDTGMQALAKSLARLQSLQSLDLNFRRLSDLTSRGVVFVFRALKRIQTLESINLDFRHCSEISSLETFRLIPAFKEFDSLKNVILDLYECRVKTFGNSQKLTLYLPGDVLDDVSMKKLSQELSALPQFQIIDFQLCETYEGLKGLEKTLEILVLEKRDVSVTLKMRADWQIRDLGRGLERLISLKNVTFFFDFPRSYYQHDSIFGEFIQSFSQGLAKLAFLKTLNLIWENRLISNLQLEQLGRGLEKLCSLESLSLSFDSSSLKGADIDYLTWSLMELKSLKSFTFSGSFQFGSVGIALTCLTTLKVLHLDFHDERNDEFRPGSTKVETKQEDSKFNSLSEALKANDCLQDIYLGVQGSDEVTDVNIEEIGSTLKILKSLKKVELRFSGCRGITEKGKLNLLRLLATIQECETNCLVEVDESQE